MDEVGVIDIAVHVDAIGIDVEMEYLVFVIMVE